MLHVAVTPDGHAIETAELTIIATANVVHFAPPSFIQQFEDCPDIPFSPRGSSDLTCALDTPSIISARDVLSMQDCVNSVTSRNLDILYAFYNLDTQLCYGFTAAQCPQGASVSNPGYRGAVIRYSNPSATRFLPSCNDIDPDDYFTSIKAKAGGGQEGTLRGKPVRYTISLNPRQVQPTPALQRSLDLRIDLSPYLSVKTAQMRRPAGSSTIVPVIDRNADTVVWNNIGDALLGVGSKKAVPQRLTFSIVSTLATNAPTGIEIEAYLVDEVGDVCEVLVAVAEVIVREPSGMKDVWSG